MGLGRPPLDRTWGRRPDGARLLVDTRPRRFEADDVVLFRDPEGGLRIAKVRQLLPAADGGRAWLETNRSTCPGIDSDELGPLPLERLVGRSLFPLPR